MSKQRIQLVAAVTLLALAGVILYRQLLPPPDPYGGPITFLDDVESNAAIDPKQLDLTFVDQSGEPVNIRDLRGKKHVVLVVTRGYQQAHCVFCTAQTSRLIANYRKFAERDAEVLVVYPGPREHLSEFLTAVKTGAQDSSIPFPLLFDEDLKAVEQLGIRWQLARPSTFIIDKQGNLCFAYIGKAIADRPSIDAMLEQLDRLDSAPASP